MQITIETNKRKKTCEKPIQLHATLTFMQANFSQF